MCEFFSLVSDGKGNINYFDHKIRKKIRSGELDYEEDSHTSIADYFGFRGADEDKLNKYEFNPISKKFKIDQLNSLDDSKKVKAKCLKLDFKYIEPLLIIKPITNPLETGLTNKKDVTKEDIENLKEWSAVYNSTNYLVYKAVCELIYDSVDEAVWNLIWDSARDLGKDSAWNLGRGSSRDSICAYVSSFFTTRQKYNLKPAINLWERGLIPSFDGITWRLYGKDGKLLYRLK